MILYNYITLWIVMILVFIIGLVEFVIIPIIDKSQDIKQRQNTNDLYKIFMQIDPKECENVITSRIKEYIDKYVIYNITGKNKSYINKDDTIDMIQSVSKHVYIELPELYIFYINMIFNLNSDDPDILLKYIHDKVREQVLLFITEFNKPQ